MKLIISAVSSEHVFGNTIVENAVRSQNAEYLLKNVQYPLSSCKKTLPGGKIAGMHTEICTEERKRGIGRRIHKLTSFCFLSFDLT